MMGTVLVLIGLLGLPAAASGQDAPAAASPESRRQAIGMMEAILSRAVLGGAEQLAKRLGGGNPNISFFTGQARARGFVLDGYGVFFQVEIPEMQQSLVMSVTTLERDSAVARTFDSLRRVMEDLPDGPAKFQVEQLLKNLQMQVAPLPQVAQQLGQSTAQPAAGMLRATTETAPAPEPPAPPVTLVRDPRAVYREAIKSALIDAMLDYSRELNIQPGEWLSVAAVRGDSLLPDEIVTSPTLVLRIKGSDLAAYQADRNQKDEIRKRVEVSEF